MSFGGGSGSSSIAGSTDVVLNSPANNQVLGYNSSLAKWQNQTASGGAAPTSVTGARDDGTAFASLLAALVARNLIVDNTTATVVTPGPSVAPSWWASQVGPGEVGTYYTFTYIATGSPTPTYAVTAGSLPPGLSLTSAGVLSGTPTTAGSYTFTVTASNGVLPDIIRERTIAITAVPVAGGLVYGAGMGYDAKGNEQIRYSTSEGAGIMAIKFKASTTSALNAVRFTQRSGPGYSGGNGGTMTVQVRPDNGSGQPHASTVLSTMSFNPVAYADNTEIYDLKTFSSPANLTAGNIYYIVFSNPDTNNFISVNNIYNYNPNTPRQPRFADTDFAIMESYSNAWSFHTLNYYMPVVDLVYANGVIDGQCYYESMNPQSQDISGTNSRIRENMLVSGGDQSVTGVYARVRRTSGTSPLILTLKNSAGTAIDSVSIPYSSIPVSAGGVDAPGAVWVGASFGATYTLASGSRYFLELSTAADSTYTTWPIRARGNPQSYQSFSFTDGVFEYATTGTNWARGYYDPYQVNMQMYLTLA